MLRIFLKLLEDGGTATDPFQIGLLRRPVHRHSKLFVTEIVKNTKYGNMTVIKPSKAYHLDSVSQTG